MIAWSSTMTCPDNIAPLAMITRLPISQLCATWQEAMIKHSSPILTDEPSWQEELIVTNSRISQFFPIKTKVVSPLYFKSWAFVPILADGQIIVPSPIVVFPSIYACDLMTTLSQSVTVPLTTAYASIVTLLPIFAPASMIAVG